MTLHSPSKNSHLTTSIVADGLPQTSVHARSRANDGLNARVEAVASTSQKPTSTTMWACTTLHQPTPSRHTPRAAAQSHLACSMAQAMPDLKCRMRKHHLRYHYQNPQSRASPEAGDDQASGHNRLPRRLCLASLECHMHRATNPGQKSRRLGLQLQTSLEPQAQSMPVAQSDPKMH
jgi:hypothetical protein